MTPTTVSTQAGQLKDSGLGSVPTSWSNQRTLPHEMLPNRYIHERDLARSKRSANQPPSQFPKVIPASTTPMTEVQV